MLGKNYCKHFRECLHRTFYGISTKAKNCHFARRLTFIPLVKETLNSVDVVVDIVRVVDNEILSEIESVLQVLLVERRL